MRRMLVAVGLFAILAQSFQAFGQQLGSKSEIEDRFRSQTSDLSSLLFGNTKYDPEKHRDLLVLASKNYVYRVTWSGSPTPPNMETVRKEFAQYIGDRLAKNESKTANTDAVKDALCKEVAARFDEVFALDFEQNRLAHVNAALMLADFGSTKNIEARNYLVSLVKNPKAHELIKLYAIKGLAEFFPAREFAPLLEKGKKNLEDQRARDIELIDLLAKAVERNWKVGENTPVEEVEGIRYLRREAIKSLALATVPAAEVNHGGTPEGIAVVALMRVCTGELNPPPSLTEKLEAALGICRVKKTPTSKYNPEVGVYLVARTLHEFLSAYQRDYSEFKVNKDRPPATSWKLHSERIRASMDLLVNGVKNAAAKEDAEAVKNAQELKVAVDDALGQMKLHNALTGGQIDRVGQLADRIKPASPVVFRNVGPMPLKLN